MFQLLIWVGVTIAALLLEVFTVAMVSIWFVVGGIFSAIACILGAPFWAQALTFFAVSGVCAWIFHRFWKHGIKAKFVPTNADRIIGKTAIVTEQIDNLSGTGEVKVSGQYWTARTKTDGSLISPGQKVVIQEIVGNKVYVTPLQE